MIRKNLAGIPGSSKAGSTKHKGANFDAAGRAYINDREGCSLGDLLQGWLPSEDVSAVLAQGRVFVAGRRVDDGLLVLSLGQKVEVRDPSRPGSALEILGEFGGLWAVNKPADLPTEPDRQSTQGCLIQALAELKQVPATELHALNRLDLNVSGIVLVATSQEARQKALALREAGGIQRRYVAIAQGEPQPRQGRWAEPVRAKGKSVAQDAATGYRWVASGSIALEGKIPTLLALEPETGRTHQLRIHAAQAGVPFLGDRAYGGLARVVGAEGSVTPLPRVMLHAARVILRSKTRVLWTVEAPVPSLMRSVWSSLGGTDSAWDDATGDGGS